MSGPGRHYDILLKPIFLYPTTTTTTTIGPTLISHMQLNTRICIVNYDHMKGVQMYKMYLGQRFIFSRDFRVTHA